MPEPLETRLRALGDELAWPATPELAASVTAALAGREDRVLGAAGRGARDAAGRGAGGAARRDAGWPRRRVLAGIAAALLVLIPAGGAAAFPQARDEVLEWLGLRRTEVRRTTRPPVAPRPAGPDFGTRTSLERIARAGLRPLVPAGLGEPDAVHVDETGAATRTTLVYGARESLPGGLLVTQARGDLNGDLLLKIAGPGTGVRRTRIGGRPAVLFTGADHVYLYLDPSGDIVEDRPWRAGTTLVLERGDAVVRLEAEAPAATLRRLAGSLRVSR